MLSIRLRAHYSVTPTVLPHIIRVQEARSLVTGGYRPLDPHCLQQATNNKQACYPQLGPKAPAFAAPAAIDIVALFRARLLVFRRVIHDTLI